jgi:uncharacterized membrane protein YgaE (UPF0421/DUF939 family)
MLKGWLQHFLPGVQLALRGSAAAALSLALGRWLNLDEPIFALIAAVIVTDRNVAESRKLAARRILSTTIGGLCGVGLSSVFHQSSLEVAVSIFVAMMVSTAVTQLSDPKFAAYLCALILINHSERSLQYAYFLFFETALGIIVGWAVSMVPKLVHLDDAPDDQTRS